MNDANGQNPATRADLKIGRIAFLTSAHPWDDPRIFQKEAVSLAADNYDVTLVARRDSSAVVNGVKIDGPECFAPLNHAFKSPDQPARKRSTSA